MALTARGLLLPEGGGRPERPLRLPDLELIEALGRGIAPLPTAGAPAAGGRQHAARQRRRGDRPARGAARAAAGLAGQRRRRGNRAEHDEPTSDDSGTGASAPLVVATPIILRRPPRL